ncbi:hypothetical protein fugu_008528 [Takifugu bimaculatus]|uniref:Uncharacterized protein n=1 Tax=Takifugu bimaculatus TaxID=433685 RepID=A0A4Z2B261_9TELE|nr:hypothetical protein fugu_008528 [Takifugu bimaculatus]
MKRLRCLRRQQSLLLRGQWMRTQRELQQDPLKLRIQKEHQELRRFSATVLRKWLHLLLQESHSSAETLMEARERSHTPHREGCAPPTTLAPPPPEPGGVGTSAGGSFHRLTLVLLQRRQNHRVCSW